MSISVRARAYLIAIVLTGAVLWPLQWPEGRDGFPLSTYPMFTFRREGTVPVRHVLVQSADGQLRPVPPDLVANGAVMQASRTVRSAIQDGRADRLCAEVARRMARADDRRRPTPATVVVATSTFEISRYFSGDRQPLSREEHARCPLPPAVP